jgi:hypothetical protein
MTQSTRPALHTVLEQLAHAKLELQAATNFVMQAAWQIEVEYWTKRMLREEGRLTMAFDDIYPDDEPRYWPPD